MKNKIIYNGFTLVEGKKYRWSGYSEGLYADHHWSKMKCKIIKIEDGNIHIQQKIYSGYFTPIDSKIKEIVQFTIDSLLRDHVEFYKIP